jgi:hypothetical protein
MKVAAVNQFDERRMPSRQSAFLNVALRRTARLKDAFALARTLVGKREARNGFVPSHPQMAGGENVEPLFIARP